MFFSIPNLSAQSATAMEKPWEHPIDPETPYHMAKAEFGAWGLSYATKHAYISMYEGMSAEVRVCKDNPVFRMHGVIADYDGSVPPDPVENLKRKPASEYMPQWAVTTHRDKARLVWLFEKPVLIADPVQLKAFLRILTKQLRVDRWLAGLDTGAFGSCEQYYEIGKKWTPVAPESVIRTAFLELWIIKASEGLEFGTRITGGGSIPMADIAEQVAHQYPGRWNGPFALGARGVRFWDPSADNPTGAIVREDGMQCFTGNQAFVGWRQIFGPAFVDKYETKAVSGLIEDTAYDGKSFWVKAEDGWIDVSKEDFSQELRVRGISPTRKPNETASAVDRLEATIKKSRRVYADAPFLYDTRDIVPYKGLRYLNTATVKCLEPAPPFDVPLTFAEGREKFPFLYQLLKSMFTLPRDEDQDQLEAFLAWLQYFYVHSLNHDPRMGQCIVIAGPAGKGKTLLVKHVLAPLMAGSRDGEQDATRFLVEGSQFNNRLMYSPIWRIDDQIPKGDRSQITEFTGRIKRAVSDPDTVSEEKFRKSRTTPHYGRIIILCNLDGESMQIMPNTDVSTLDKICLFRASDHTMRFPENATVERLCHQELPAFARFLVDWQTPERWVAENRRFGVTSYHHPELLAEAKQLGAGEIVELLGEFLEQYKAQYPDKTSWVGTSTRLFGDLSLMNPAAMRHVRPRALSTKLGVMATNGFNLAKERDLNGSPVWTIGFNLNDKR